MILMSPYDLKEQSGYYVNSEGYVSSNYKYLADGLQPAMNQPVGDRPGAEALRNFSFSLSILFRKQCHCQWA